MAAYLELHRSGKLSGRVNASLSLLERCSVCPRNCGVNRLAGDVGKCRTAREAMVSSYGPHFGAMKVLLREKGDSAC